MPSLLIRKREEGERMKGMSRSIEEAEMVKVGCGSVRGRTVFFGGRGLGF